MNKAVVLWIWLLSFSGAALANPEQIVQQILTVEKIAPEAGPLVSRLDLEVGKVVAAGHLMPFRVQYGEGKVRHHYAEPWIMMYTLARAYPYVSKEAQSRIITYLRQEAQLYAPWGTNALGPAGAYRQGDPKGVAENGLPPRYRRTGTMLYALWLYGHQTRDWSTIRPQWNELQGAYREIAASPPTYEHISGAIAMSRMAQAFGDSSSQKLFATEAIKFMQAGTNFEVFRRNAHVAYSGKPDWYRGSSGIAFALFYLTPEVARSVAEQPELKRAVETYVEKSMAVWPLWWMAQAPVGDDGYFDEGSCVGPETRMMLFNYVAWVRQTPAKELRLRVDVPDALVGDCYYLQNLVTAIEAYGQPSWR